MCESGKQENGVPYFPQMLNTNKAACSKQLYDYMYMVLQSEQVKVRSY